MSGPVCQLSAQTECASHSMFSEENKEENHPNVGSKAFKIYQDENHLRR